MSPEWIAIDHGGAVPRAWAMYGTDALDRNPTTPEAALTRWPSLPRVAAGDADAPLVPLPFEPLAVLPRADDGPYLLPGIARPRPVLEASSRIAGFMALNPGWDGVLCLPGPQTHWAHISAREIVSLQSFLGEDLLKALHRVPPLDDLAEDPDDAGFAEAVSDAMSRPERLAATLANPGSLARLHGALIGTELAAARPYWLGQQVAVIGQPDAAAKRYAAALSAQGVPVTQTNEISITLAGLSAAWLSLKGPA